MQLIDKDLLSMQEVRELVEAAKEAQQELARMDQAQVDRIVRAIADAGVRNARRLAQMANDPKMASKPEKVREGIVTGKLGKFYKENCLLQQEFVKDNAMTVEQYIASVAKTLGGTITFKNAVRFEKGEGIEKKQENFAEEIASMVKG